MQTLSRYFSITRGVKQGGPISGLLFISVLECCMQALKDKWGTKVGTNISNSDMLTNLRFADDIVLIATSRNHIKQMSKDLKDEAAT